MRALINTKWEHFAGKFLNIKQSQENPKLLRDVRKFYLKNSNISLETLKEAGNMISDKTFFLDNHDAVAYHSKGADVYPYYYTYNGRYAMAKLLFVKKKLPFKIPDRYEFHLGCFSTWFSEYVLNVNEPNKFGIGHGDEV